MDAPTPFEPVNIYRAWTRVCRRLRPNAQALGLRLIGLLDDLGWPEELAVARAELGADPRSLVRDQDALVATGIWSVAASPGRPNRWRCDYQYLLAHLSTAQPVAQVQQRPEAPAPAPAPAPQPPAPRREEDPTLRAFGPEGSRSPNTRRQAAADAPAGVTESQRAIEATPEWADAAQYVADPANKLGAKFWAQMTKLSYLDILAPRRPSGLPQEPAMEPSLLLEALRRTAGRASSPAYTQKILEGWRDRDIFTLANLQEANGPRKETKPQQSAAQQPPPEEDWRNDPAYIRSQKIAAQYAYFEAQNPLLNAQRGHVN